MASLMEGLLTNTNQIELKWLELTDYFETGGAEITSYNIRWDQGKYGLVWDYLVGFESNMLENEYIVTQSILPSREYRFQIRAKNKWGWGDWSSVLSIFSSTWPDVVEKPTTQIDPNKGDVVISWVAPDSRGAQISQYLIELRDAIDINNWTTATLYCNGQNRIIINSK